jgi:ComF family protein
MCEGCWHRLPWIHGASCTHCGKAFEGEGVYAKQCPACIALNPYFQTGKSLLSLKEGARDWIHGLKYSSGWHLFPDVSFAITCFPEIKDYLEGTILVPVPLHPRRERLRGYNQSLLIAEGWARATNTVCKHLLLRKYPTISQTELSREERLKNVKAAFGLKKNTRLSLGITYTLIDDVYTTGATLNACAKVLHDHGVSNIQILTLAHG